MRVGFDVKLLNLKILINISVNIHELKCLRETEGDPGRCPVELQKYSDLGLSIKRKHKKIRKSNK